MSKVKKKKYWQFPSAGEDVGQLVLPCIAGRNAKWSSHSGTRPLTKFITGLINLTPGYLFTGT